MLFAQCSRLFKMGFFNDLKSKIKLGNCGTYLTKKQNLSNIIFFGTNILWSENNCLILVL